MTRDQDIGQEALRGEADQDGQERGAGDRRDDPTARRDDDRQHERDQKRAVADGRPDERARRLLAPEKGEGARLLGLLRAGAHDPRSDAVGSGGDDPREEEHAGDDDPPCGEARQTDVLQGSDRFVHPHGVPRRAAMQTPPPYAVPVPFVIYGTFMTGQPGHGNLEGVTPLERVRTAPRYRLWFVDGRWPALVPAVDGVELEVELYDLDEAHVERLAELEPPGWARAPVELADGRVADAFLGDRELIRRGIDVSRFGSWAAFVASSAAHG
jgi:gamma-glutamylcyclotransferase (GGCT)/AIG2-like uncharacterized protein YtfP